MTNSIGWGNYKDATESAGEDAGILQTTGKNEAWKAKNIYDLAGNAQEWSMEDADGFLRMLRGGAWDGSGTGNPASYRYGDFPDTCGSNYSFRPVLYLTILE